MGRVKCDQIKRLITLTSGNIKRLSLYKGRATILCPLAKLRLYMCHGGQISVKKNLN